MEDNIAKKIVEFLTGVGAMVELWGLTYNKFKSIGYPDDMALEHTAAFLTMIVSTLKNGGNNE